MGFQLFLSLMAGKVREHSCQAMAHGPDLAHKAVQDHSESWPSWDYTGHVVRILQIQQCYVGILAHQSGKDAQ